MIVGDEQHRQSHSEEQHAQLGDEAVAQRPVERTERFVEHEESGLRRERPGERDSLLLAPGEFRDPPVGEPGEAHEVEGLGDPCLRDVACDVLHAQPERDVPGHVPMGEQRVVLEHQPEAAPVRRHLGEIVGIPRHVAGGARLQSRDHAQQRALATPARAEHTDDLAVAHVEAHAVERARAVVVELQVAGVQHQNVPTEPTRNRSMARITRAVMAMRMTLAAIAAPKLSGPGVPSSR